MTTISEGSVLGDRYVLLGAIASGGMGDVWRATDQRLGREVAVKVLRGEFGQDEITRQRFRFEARAAASLACPGVATVFDYGEEWRNGGSHRAYIVMELIHGESVEERVRREGRLGVRETLDIIEQAAVALQVAHDRGLVHRDIKAANLLIRTDGAVKLTDFGIARALDGSTLTQEGTTVGTVRYMSPEQLSGREATPASDLYALGIVAYFCLTGRTPFDHQESMAVALAHVHDPLPPMPPEVPIGVAEFVARLLAKDPRDRPTSAGAVASGAAALKNAAAPPPAQSPPMPVSTSAQGRTGTRPIPRTSSRYSDAHDPTLADAQMTSVMSAPISADIDNRRPPHRRLQLWILLSALGAAVAAVMAFWVFAGPDRVSVPRLTGLTANVAAQRVTQLGLHADLHLLDADQTAGRVISQTPRAATSVVSGTPVQLNIASGFETIDTTALLMQTAQRASAVLSSLGMRPSQTSVISTATPGQVVSISPSGRVRLGTTVIIGVAVAPPPPTTTTTTTTEAQAPPPHKKAAKGHGTSGSG